MLSFTLGYWLAGLGERGGWASGMIASLASRLPRKLMLTASLRDEHVLLARAPAADARLQTPARALVGVEDSVAKHQEVGAGDRLADGGGTIEQTHSSRSG